MRFTPGNIGELLTPGGVHRSLNTTIHQTRHIPKDHRSICSHKPIQQKKNRQSAEDKCSGEGGLTTKSPSKTGGNRIPGGFVEKNPDDVDAKALA